jgi:hypothetical protein
MLLPTAALAMCFAHPVDLDVEVVRRAVPWMPPDLARQVIRHQQEARRGAAAAASWPRQFHEMGGRNGLEASVSSQCQRLVSAIRNHTPFSEIVAGLGALAHAVVDVNSPFTGYAGANSHAQAFSTYLGSATARVPMVYYGIEPSFLRLPASGFANWAQGRRDGVSPLASIVQEDLDRLGGPAAWSQLDDRSSSFGTASVVLNHAATDLANLSSWIWRRAGGLVPELVVPENGIVVWKGVPQPRETPSTRLGFRQAWP